jgi:hypothetical protein
MKESKFLIISNIVGIILLLSSIYLASIDFIYTALIVNLAGVYIISKNINVKLTLKYYKKGYKKGYYKGYKDSNDKVSSQIDNAINNIKNNLK